MLYPFIFTSTLDRSQLQRLESKYFVGDKLNEAQNSSGNISEENFSTGMIIFITLSNYLLRSASAVLH